MQRSANDGLPGTADPKCVHPLHDGSLYTYLCLSKLYYLCSPKQFSAELQLRCIFQTVSSSSKQSGRSSRYLFPNVISAMGTDDSFFDILCRWRCGPPHHSGHPAQRSMTFHHATKLKRVWLSNDAFHPSGNLPTGSSQKFVSGPRTRGCDSTMI